MAKYVLTIKQPINGILKCRFGNIFKLFGPGFTFEADSVSVEDVIIDGEKADEKIELLKYRCPGSPDDECLILGTPIDFDKALFNETLEYDGRMFSIQRN